MSDALLIFLYVLGGILAGAGIVWFLSGRKKPDSDEGAMKLLLEQMNELTRTVDSKIGESFKQTREAVQFQFTESQRLLKDTSEQMAKHLSEVTKGVTESTEASKQVFTITEQFKNLEKVLKHQKQRGNLGEASLELILGNMLPANAYKMQYQFDDGDIVDAAVFTKDGLIPVDSKFSLDNYNRILNEEDDIKKALLEKEFSKDLKKRIDETAKYIKPEKNTLPFAFMFIPAEGIYYDLLVNEVGAVTVNTRSLIDYAYKDKNVIIVSPTTFAAYLQSVLYGFRAFKIEESAKEIRKRVEDLTRHIGAYNEYYEKVGKSLGTTVNHYNAASKEFKKIDKDVLRITGDSAGVEPELLDKPDEGE